MKARLQVLTIERVRIGDNLKRWRKYRLMTQQELADAAELGVASVVRIENNRTEPRFSTIKKLADALDLEARQLISERPPNW
jgi:transcriptional regulator with XRE-family HTH domain